MTHTLVVASRRSLDHRIAAPSLILYLIHRRLPTAVPVFSVVFALRDGLADDNVWDVKSHAHWLRAINEMVEVKGLTCSRRAIGFSEDWDKAPGDLALHANKGKYRIVVNKGTVDTNIPMNPDIPLMWFRQKSAQSTPETPTPLATSGSSQR